MPFFIHSKVKESQVNGKHVSLRPVGRRTLPYARIFSLFDRGIGNKEVGDEYQKLCILVPTVIGSVHKAQQIITSTFQQGDHNAGLASITSLHMRVHEAVSNQLSSLTKNAARPSSARTKHKAGEGLGQEFLLDTFRAAACAVEAWGAKVSDALHASASLPAARLASRLRQLKILEERTADVRVSSLRPMLGDTLVVLVTTPESQSFLDSFQLYVRGVLKQGPLVQVRYGGSQIPAYMVRKGPSSLWRALIATTPLDTPGPRELVVSVRDGRHGPYRQIVELQDCEYPTESIWLPEGKSGRKGITRFGFRGVDAANHGRFDISLSSALSGGYQRELGAQLAGRAARHMGQDGRGTGKEWAAVGALGSVQTPQQLWALPLQEPSTGVITTGYGLKRYYNGVFADGYYHRGLDYGADVGEPVVAPAGGRVVLVGREADGFEVHGNCVGLDHGHGVTSMLMHLHSLSVSEGAVVERGQVIGTVGDTGAATGPHLHWGLYVNGDCINPNQWLQSQTWG